MPGESSILKDARVSLPSAFVAWANCSSLCCFSLVSFKRNHADGCLLLRSCACDRDSYDAEKAAELKKRRAFRKFSYRGVELDALLDLPNEEFVSLLHARARRRIGRGLKRKPMNLIKKLRKAKKEAPPNEKPTMVKTHLRDMIIVPEMVGSVIGVYNGKVSWQVLEGGR